MRKAQGAKLRGEGLAHGEAAGGTLRGGAQPLAGRKRRRVMKPADRLEYDRLKNLRREIELVRVEADRVLRDSITRLADGSTKTLLQQAPLAIGLVAHVLMQRLADLTWGTPEQDSTVFMAYDFDEEFTAADSLAQLEAEAQRFTVALNLPTKSLPETALMVYKIEVMALQEEGEELDREVQRLIDQVLSITTRAQGGLSEIRATIKHHRQLRNYRLQKGLMAASALLGVLAFLPWLPLTGLQGFPFLQGGTLLGSGGLMVATSIVLAGLVSYAMVALTRSVVTQYQRGRAAGPIRPLSHRNSRQALILGTALMTMAWVSLLIFPLGQSPIMSAVSTLPLWGQGLALMLGVGALVACFSTIAGFVKGPNMEVERLAARPSSWLESPVRPTASAAGYGDDEAPSQAPTYPA